MSLWASVALGLALAPSHQHPRCAKTPGFDAAIVAHDRACFDFQPDRTFSGIWIDAFEGQTFTEGAKTIADIRSKRSSTWIDIDRPWRGAQPMAGRHRADLSQPHAYLVRFVGAQAVSRNGKDGFGLPSGYGHLGMFTDLVVVDRVVSIEDLGPLD